MSKHINWQEINKKFIEEFRENGGKDGFLLLHTVGAKSGQPRLNPLAYLADGERFIVAAAKAGAARNPDWYYNILANPQVIVEIGTQKFQASATIAIEPERTELFQRLTELVPINVEYQRQTTRIFPIVILTRSI